MLSVYNSIVVKRVALECYEDVVLEGKKEFNEIRSVVLECYEDVACVNEIRRELNLEPFVVLDTEQVEEEVVRRAVVNEACPQCHHPQLEYQCHTEQLEKGNYANLSNQVTISTQQLRKMRGRPSRIIN